MDDGQLNRIIWDAMERIPPDSEVTPEFVEKMARKYAAWLQIGIPAMQLDGERQDRALAMWEIFTPHMAAGAKTWEEILAACSEDDLRRIDEIRGGLTADEVLDP